MNRAVPVLLSEDFTLDQLFRWLRANRRQDEDLLDTAQRVLVTVVLEHHRGQRSVLDPAGRMLEMSGSRNRVRRRMCGLGRGYGMRVSEW